jgi:hypothetical protein
MTDELGPYDCTNASTTRPVDSAAQPATDYWFVNCSSPTAQDGSQIGATFLNRAVANLRALWRGAGNLGSGSPVNPDTYSDNGLLDAVLQLIQRGQPSAGVDVGAANALVVNPTPAWLEYKTGARLYVAPAATVTGATVINVSGLGNKPITWADGTPLGDNDWPAGATGEMIVSPAGNFHLLSVMGPSVFLRAPGNTPTTFYVNAASGNDANNGLLSGTAFKTLAGAQAAISGKYASLTGVTVNIADGAYAGFSVGPSLIAYWNFVGNLTTPGNVTITAASGAVNQGRSVIANGAKVNLSGVTFSSYLQNVASYSGAQVNISACNLTGSANAPSLAASSGGIFVSGAIGYSGAGQGIFYAENGGLLKIASQDGVTTTPCTLTLTGTPAFSVACADAVDGGDIIFTSSAITISGAATGQRYAATVNGVINTALAGASYLPGSVAGVYNTGGQYL